MLSIARSSESLSAASLVVVKMLYLHEEEEH